MSFLHYNAFLSAPTNELIGKFKIASPYDLPRALTTFLAGKPAIPLFSYIQAGGISWTITSFRPLQLAEGIIPPPSSEDGANDQRTYSHANADTEIQFGCVDCGTTLLFRLKHDLAVYRCPCCKTQYRTVQTSDSRPVLLVVPTSRFRSERFEDQLKKRKCVPPEVVEALRVFGLKQDAGFEQIRRAYREHMKQYHPDLVIHLGLELRKLAEAKAKEFNKAYQVLSEFHSPQR
jgi:hypothetical protein